MQMQKIVTGVAMAPTSVSSAVDATVGTPLHWVAIGMLAVTVAHVGFQMLAPHRFNIERTVAVAALPLVAIMLEKTLFVVEGLMYPAFNLYEGVPGTYTPSWVELSSLVGALAIVVLFFLVAVKAVPVVELEHEEEAS